MSEHYRCAWDTRAHSSYLRSCSICDASTEEGLLGAIGGDGDVDNVMMAYVALPRVF